LTLAPGMAAAPRPDGECTGEIESIKGNFGFIKQDMGGENMFVMPKACAEFGEQIPPLGTRVIYEVVVDAKTGRPRADNVRPEVSSADAAAAMPQLSALSTLSYPEAVSSAASGQATGTMHKDNGSFGFIQQDAGEETMFVIPGACAAFGGLLPPVGTRVAYNVVMDTKTGRPRADNVQPLGSEAWLAPERNHSTLQMPAASAAPSLSGVHSGTMSKGTGKFGFIQPDIGEEGMFVLPGSCASVFGGILPPVGTRLVYEVVIDDKTGRPRAENVQPEEVARAPAMPALAAPPRPQRAVASAPAASQNWKAAGTFARDQGKFGFIQQDSDGAEMFVMPNSCTAFLSKLPPLGTRVVFDVVTDQKTGRPRAENVEPEVSVPPGSLNVGTFFKDNGNFGFIQPDNGDEKMFVLPKSCAAFGERLPPVGARVIYDVVTDQKTGRPRAENVAPEGSVAVAQNETELWEAALQRELSAAVWEPPTKKLRLNEPAAVESSMSGSRAGTFTKDSGNFGFIQQDSLGPGEEETMFVIPSSCVGFDRNFPPLGTRVLYDVVVDQKTGRPRAENVQPEAAVVRTGPAWTGSAWTSSSRTAFSAAPVSASPAASPRATGRGTGTFARDSGSFGFIEQDSGEDKMFVMPKSCTGFGERFPPIGTRVAYDVVMDQKTGRPRAEGVAPESASMASSAPGHEFSAWDGAHSCSSHGKRAGTFVKDSGNFGFIQQDDIPPGEEPQMFVLPSCFVSFGMQFPPMGTRVVYDVVVDQKTARPRAENVEPEPAPASQEAWSDEGARARPTPGVRVRNSAAAPSQPPSWRQPVMQGQHAGTFSKDNGSFGFIQPDVGEEMMFVMPLSCQGFSERLPPVGTRVWYDVVIDQKTGRPRADNVQPEDWAGPPQQASRPLPMLAAPSNIRLGTVVKDNGSFGFIQQDCGEENMFLMPKSCTFSGNVLPPLGTRVAYEVVLDSKTGRPRAENVQPEQPYASPSSWRGAGVIEKDNGSFGFIRQDSGEENMFLMPKSCAAFGGVIPPLGTRVVYDVVVDQKTGRPRAEQVQPEPTSYGSVRGGGDNGRPSWPY